MRPAPNRGYDAAVNIGKVLTGHNWLPVISNANYLRRDEIADLTADALRDVGRVARRPPIG